RFKAEAQAAASLHHTNIVPVHFVGCERGVHFYAMQLIQGTTLAMVIQELRRSASTGAKPSLRAHSTPRTESPAATPTISVMGLTTEGSPKSQEFFRTVARLGMQAAEALKYA